MSNEKVLKFFTKAVSVMFYVSFATNAFAQVTLQGQGGTEIMMFAGRVTDFVFKLSLVGCLISLMIAGYHFSKGDQHGQGKVWAAVGGTAIVAAATGLLHYFVFAAQDTGMASNVNGAPF